jgi:hypothetical protein
MQSILNQQLSIPQLQPIPLTNPIPNQSQQEVIMDLTTTRRSDIFNETINQNLIRPAILPTLQRSQTQNRRHQNPMVSENQMRTNQNPRPMTQRPAPARNIVRMGIQPIQPSTTRITMGPLQRQVEPPDSEDM